MLTAEIKINGALIGHLYAVNEKKLPGGEHLYRFGYYEPDGVNAEGNVKHNRNAGALTLIKKIIDLV